MKIKQADTGASPEELLEIIQGLLIVIEKHKLHDLLIPIKDDEQGFNLLDRCKEILAKVYPDIDSNENYSGSSPTDPK